MSVGKDYHREYRIKNRDKINAYRRKLWFRKKNGLFLPKKIMPAGTRTLNKVGSVVECIKCKRRLILSRENFYFDRRGQSFASRCKKCASVDSTDRYRRISQMPFSDFWLRVKFNKKKRSSPKRGIEFSLSFEEYKKIYSDAKFLCHYCGQVPQIATIDRKDNSLGYFYDNCCLACLYCNGVKSNRFSFEEMVIIGKVYKQIFEDRKTKNPD